MLSLRGIRDPAHVAHYFRTDDLMVEGRLTSGWAGRWAEAFHLAPPVSPEVFRAFLDGRLPDGTEIGRRVGTGRIHAPGFDATFSAPKSVSIAALVWGDRRLVDAHDQAVRSTLEWMDVEHCYLLQTIAGIRQHTPGEGLLAATFRHGLSRLADPQLHSHAVVFNFTGTGHGTFRSLAGRPVFNAGKLIGAYYRLELAAAVQAIGYAIRRTRTGFELAKVSPALLRVWSKRSRDIEGMLAERQSSRAWASGRQKQYVTLLTRPAKKPVAWETVSRRWLSEYQRVDPSAERVLPWRPDRDLEGFPPEPDPVSRVGHHIAEALTDLDRQYGRFRRIEVYARVFERTLGEMEASRLWRVLPPLLDPAVQAAPAPGWAPVSLGSDWLTKKVPAPALGCRLPPSSVHLTWGSLRAASQDFLGILDRTSSDPLDPVMLKVPFSRIEALEGHTARASADRFLLFYLPPGAPLTLLDRALDQAARLGLALALLEIPRREFGLIRYAGRYHLEYRGLRPELLRYERRDAFLRERRWQPCPTLERERFRDHLPNPQPDRMG